MKTVEVESPLTVRETQIVAMVAEGWSAKEIARSAGITPRTVESHLDAVRIKLRARNRVHLVALAISHNWLPPLSTALEAA